MQNHLTINEVKKKLEHFCAYQERCHAEVIGKLRSFGVNQAIIDEVVVHLIEQNFLNEERFALAYASGKHRIKTWGNVRIAAELKARNISQRNIDTALSGIPYDEYVDAFEKISDKHWESLGGRNDLKKRKKFCDYLIRKGFETDLIYSKVKRLEQST